MCIDQQFRQHLKWGAKYSANTPILLQLNEQIVIYASNIIYRLLDVSITLFIVISVDEENIDFEINITLSHVVE